jgi:cytochrome c oxidase subunit 3
MGPPAEAAAEVAAQFETQRQQRQASTLGMWVFLNTEVMIFGGLFLAYFVYRALYPETFAAASKHLDLMLATFNTAVLLTSSLTIALAVHAAGTGSWRAMRALLAATAALGAVFLAIKGYEYAKEFAENLAPFLRQPFHWPGAEPGQAELFFNLYFLMTGLHALHLVGGISLVTWLIVRPIGRGGGAAMERLAENVGLYWHLIDVVWVFLYPTLYLIDR